MSDAALDIPASHDDLDGVPPPAATPTLFGHRSEFAELAAAEAAGRLHHAWLFQGPRGVPAMRQIALGTYPGLVHVTRPPVEKGTGFRTQITVEGVRKLNRFFQATGSRTSWRIAIIDPADDMNRSAANALLKILEEPPARSVFLIMNHTPGRLLPTIRSRCRTLRFEPLEDADLAAATAAALPSAGQDEIAAAVPQDETARLREAAAYNLDRKQALLTLFDRFYRCRGAASAA